MIGDLHCHSKLSDGSTSLEDIVFYAKRAGLDALAITDHDTLAGASRAQVLGKRYGITVIPGVEISTFDPDTQRRVHICRSSPTGWQDCCRAPSSSGASPVSR
mgnify:CR=1 FL=1